MWLEIWARSPHPRPAFWHAGLSRRDQPAPMRGGRFGRARGDANLSDRIPGPTVRGRFLGGLANVGDGGTYSGDVSRHLRWSRAVPCCHPLPHGGRLNGWLASGPGHVPFCPRRYEMRSLGCGARLWLVGRLLWREGRPYLERLEQRSIEHCPAPGGSGRLVSTGRLAEASHAPVESS